MVTWLDLVQYNYRFISSCTNTFYQVSNRSNSFYRNLLLLNLILTYFQIFDFYLIILFPSEFSRIQFLSKGKKAITFKCVRCFHNFAFIVFFGIFRRLNCFYQINLAYSRSYPYEMLGILYCNYLKIPGGNYPGRNCPGGNYPRWESS